MRIPACLVLIVAASAPAGAQPASVVKSPHNLSASGPGSIRAAAENEVCIFCHAPHNSSPVRPLWNRTMPTDGYTIYTSRSLNAKPGQPTGVSKMCLSCHDGTIALGSVLSRGQTIMMAGGVTTIRGRGLLGTDLADDHPISFLFDTGLVARNDKLKAPGALPASVKLDANAELQCTTCHDAHNNALGNFLVMRNDHSELCTSCHQMGATTVAGHANCDACHQPHTSPSGPYLLRKRTIGETCLGCHDGSVALAANIAPELRKIAVHDTNSPVDPPPPLTDHVSCTDCHEAHTMMGGQAGAAPPPGVAGNFGLVSGMSASGAGIAVAKSEFEVCFKCHSGGGGQSKQGLTVARQRQDSNLRQVFSPGAVSFHPVESAGRNSMVPSLVPGLTVASRVACTSCHNSDSGRTAGGSGPEGPHGSNNDLLLAARYEVKDLTTESAQSYALCYKCHDRASILNNESFPLHSKHIVDLRTPCAACHDAHGISASTGSVTANSNLINFATLIVLPDKVTGKLEFRDTGMFRGECFLSCHGSNHSPKTYP